MLTRISKRLSWDQTAIVFFRLPLAMFACGGLLLVAFVPYHVWDALAYGEWSVLIARTGHFHFPTITDQTYHRPLFYVSQGWIWRLFGPHDAYGRAFGLVFWAALVFAVWRLSSTISACASGLSSHVGVSLLLAISGVAAGMCSGLTDVPVAAMVGCVGAVLWTLRTGRTSIVLVFVLSCLAVLVKPSALSALGGLGLAHLVGSRKDLFQRVVRGCLPLTLGASLALTYDYVEAHRLGMPLSGFLIAGTTGYYEKMSYAARLDVLGDWSWLGYSLRFPLALSVCYAAFRVLGVSHRRALGFAGPIALALTYVGPWLLPGHDARGEVLVAPGRAAFNLLLLACSGVIAWACLHVAGDDGMASRVNIARLVVWIAPALVSWSWYAAYDIRLLSVAWTPLAVLMGCAIAPLIVDGLRAHRWPAVASAAVVLLLGLSNVARLDALDWKAVGAAVAHGQFREREMRRTLMPDLVPVLEFLDRTIAPNQVLFSPEGRLRFYFPGRVDQGYPKGCEDLRGFDFFVLPTGAWTEAFFTTEIGVPGTIQYWSGCRTPSLTLILETHSYVVFRIEGAPRPGT